jgi:hypothetical protein
MRHLAQVTATVALRLNCCCCCCPAAVYWGLFRRLVKRAMHGTRMMGWQEIRQFYGREVVNLRNEGRWVFLNTLFSVSEAVMYMQVRAWFLVLGGGVVLITCNARTCRCVREEGGWSAGWGCAPACLQQVQWYSVCSTK